MFILSSAKINSSITQSLRKQYPNLSFSFCAGMKEAEKELADADILITYGEDLTEALIQKANKLKWIMVISAGLDRMPFKAIKKRGILVTNARGIHAVPMAEYTIAMILQTVRKAKVLTQQETNKVWNRKVPMTEITGSTIGVIGAGAIGQEIARLSKAFRMKTIGYSRSGKPREYFDHMYSGDGLFELLNRSDYVVSVLPSTAHTKKLLKTEHFQAMKREGIFINIGRGDTVDEKALIEALQAEAFSHAVLDVFEQEPLPENHPFWEMDNVTVTPHLSGISPQYQPRAFEIFKRNLDVFLKEESGYENIINLDRGY